VSTQDWRAVLQKEFAAEPGSFLVELRFDLRWDRAAFSRLTYAMEQCCRALAGVDVVERWLAEGFWYLSWFPRSWTGHHAWAENPARDQIDAGMESSTVSPSGSSRASQPRLTAATAGRAPERSGDPKRTATGGITTTHELPYGSAKAPTALARTSVDQTEDAAVHLRYRVHR
jgi:hypothetical protein